MHPVGPASERVYWRRRVVVLVLLVATLTLAWRALPGGGEAVAEGPSPVSATVPTTATPAAPAGSSAGPEAAGARGGVTAPAASPSAPPTTAGAATATPVAVAGTTAPAAGVTCTGGAEGALEVSVATDATSYAPGAEPELTLQVTNTGTVPCEHDLGPAALELVVTSGGQPVWSSDDCDPDRRTNVRRLEPGEAWSTTLTWSRTRSADGCGQPRPAAGPGTYEVSGRAGEVRSAEPARLVLQ
jgi:hypothetical protein